MLVTVFSDASWCPHKHVGGWGAWVKSQRLTCTKGGELKDRPSSSGEAEIMAIGNAVYVALHSGAARPGDELLIQTDCQHAIRVLEGQAKPKTAGEADVYLILVKWRAQFYLSMRYRHVKAHTNGDQPRLWVNNECDRLARHHMRNARRKAKKRPD